MEDDDEFGDLYTDVIRPIEAQRGEFGPAAAAVKAAPSQGQPVDLDIDSDDDKTSNLNPGSALGWNSNSSIREKTLPARGGFDLNLDSNSEAARIAGLIGKGGDGSGFESRVLEKGHGLELRGKASGESSFMEDDDDDDINIIVEERDDKDDDLVVKDYNFMNKEDKKSAYAGQGENTVNFVNDAAVDEMGPEPIIPGLSGRLENPRASNMEDEWESEESDDDLQIVLNDNSHGPMGMERMPGMIDEDDDDGEPLVIVADNGDVGHHQHQGQRMMDEQEWGGEEGGTGADGEKDLGDASKASGGGGGAAPAAAQPKIVYSNPAYHHPFSSQFKYVRPGAAPLPGPTPGGIPGQVRPPISMGPPAGRGRGDWRPAGIKGPLPMQKGYYGTLARGVNAAGRGYGSGLDFTLPSHKTIFEVDIDSFEEKPWKLPGIDVSDFFNFGLNEDSWRDYCKQLEQLRLEMTMQSKIRVHESGRAEKGYDPDLPPELAAAVGIQDNPSENANHGKTDAGPPDLARRTSLPVGRPIPVETGAGDRLPSIDTRRPRMHDMDAIIEIVCHSSPDGEHDNDPARKDHLGGGDEAGCLQQDHADRMYSFSPEYNGNKRVFDSRRPLSKNTVNNDDIVTEDVSHHPSEVTGHSHPDRETGLPQEERSTKGRRHARSPSLSASENKRGEHIADDLKEESFRTGDGKQSPASSSSLSIRSDRERAVVVGDEMDAVSVMDDRSFDMERVEMTSDPPNTGTCEDGNLKYPTKKQKLSLHAEPYSLENEDGEDSKAARSNDSKARSGSSEHIWSSPDNVEDGVLQHRHPLRAGNIRREVGDDENAHRKERHDRVEAGRQNMVVKGREDSFSLRGGDANSSLHWHGKTERADWKKESDISEGTWNRRDEDHRGRRTRLDDPRKREHGPDVSSRNRDKPGEREKSEKHEPHQSRNQLDNGSWRGTNNEYDIIGSRQRDNRDDHLKSRSERVDDLRSTKRKEESHMRRVHAEKDDISHNHIESSTGRKRERDDGSDKLKRDDQGRSKDDEVHYARQKEDGWSRRERSERQRERDEWYRIKQDDHLSRKERVDKRPVMRSGLAAEEKTWISHSRGNDDYKGSSREYHPKDIGRHGDQLKQRDRVENDFSQHRSHGDVYTRRNQLSNDEKRTRSDKPTSCDERVSYGPDTSRTHEHKRKETSRKSKETDSGDHSSLIPPKRNQDEDGGSVSETVNLSGRTEQQSSRGHVSHQSSRKHREDTLTDEQPDSRTGRSKLERWTSHKERDFAMTPTPSSSLKKRDRDTHNNSGGSLATGALEDPSEKIEDKPQPLVDRKDTDPETNGDDTKAVKDRHLDTVAKLKKRSERFKLPMPGEKDAIAIKKTEESEPSPVGQTETCPDSEIKSERPPRKRRWTGN